MESPNLFDRTTCTAQDENRGWKELAKGRTPLVDDNNEPNIEQEAPCRSVAEWRFRRERCWGA